MNDTTAASTRPEAAADLLALIERTVRELQSGAPGLPAVTPASRLDRDLGLDSLARTELLVRIERHFGVLLPEDTLQRAETVADLVQALARAPAAAKAPSAAASQRVAPADEARAPARAVGKAAAGVAQSVAAADTLLAVLDAHVAAQPERTQVVCLADDAERVLTYRRLAEDADAIAAGLQHAGVQPRQTVAIMLPTCPEYFGTYFGILRAGAIPVPIYPPARPSQLEDHVLRHAGILANAQAVALVTVPEAAVVARLLQARVPGLAHVLTPQALAAAGGTPRCPEVRADDIAFIQYTSGSTGNPKGVALTHANLLANMRAMRRAAAATPDDCFVSWLPLYHDMGLIGAWLTPLVVGFPLVVMSPLAFLARPLRWLQAITRHRGTLSAAPNFAYELCLKRIEDADLAGLDLSTWRLAFNGAEAVSPHTVRRFAERFARCGLRPEAVTPVYGLAEACVGLLFPPLGRVAPVDTIRRAPLENEHRAEPAPPGDAGALAFVGCGDVLEDHEVRIVDDAGQPLGERIEGRLEFRGPSATQGYYRNPKATDRLFDGDWLDTGDRAYRAGGDVYITGRVKDIVIRGGRNLYPDAIEEAVGAVEGVRKGCVAVFGLPDAERGTEALVVLAEVRAGDAEAHARVRAAIAQAVTDEIGEPPERIVLAPPHTVLKTSSGKIRRSACRALVESGRIGAAAPSAWRQVVRLALGALGPRLAHGARRALAFAQGLWLALLFWLIAPLTWIATALSPRPALAWRIGHFAARALLRLGGVPLRVSGAEHLPAGPCVLVCNHGSYADGVLLVAALSRNFAFVAKRELLDQFVSRVFLRRLGAVFVERFDAPQSVAAAEELVATVRGGQSLAVFPEGTFVDEPGLLPFHLGAFLVATRARVPVVPVTLHGNRTLLPGSRWWPRRAELTLDVHAPLADFGDRGDAFAAAVRLRDAARQAIGASAARATENAV